MLNARIEFFLSVWKAVTRKAFGIYVLNQVVTLPPAVIKNRKKSMNGSGCALKMLALTRLGKLALELACS